ncbi:hypothetical protein [Flavobacterium johnsoniae]
MESEKQAFTRSKSMSRYKLESSTATLESAKSLLERISIDWQNIEKRIQKNKDGTVTNPVKLIGLSGDADTKQIGQKLNLLADKSRTEGQYEEIGTLYGFTLLVKTEVSQKEGISIRDNRFLFREKEI